MQDGEQQQSPKSDSWADETVDALAALVVVTALTLMALWFVIS